MEKLECITKEQFNGKMGNAISECTIDFCEDLEEKGDHVAEADLEREDQMLEQELRDERSAFSGVEAVASAFKEWLDTGKSNELSAKVDTVLTRMAGESQSVRAIWKDGDVLPGWVQDEAFRQ